MAPDDADSDSTDDDRPDPEALRERAAAYENLEETLDDIHDGFEQILDSDLVDDATKQRFSVLEDIFGYFRHGCAFGQAAHHARMHADRVERERRIEQAEADADDGPIQGPPHDGKSVTQQMDEAYDR